MEEKRGKVLPGEGKVYRVGVTLQLPSKVEKEIPITMGLKRRETAEHAEMRHNKVRDGKKRRPSRRVLDPTSGVSLAQLSDSLHGFTLTGSVPELRDGNLTVRYSFIRTDMVTGRQKPPESEEVAGRQTYFAEHQGDIWVEFAQVLQNDVGDAWVYRADAEVEGYKAITIIFDNGKHDAHPEHFLVYGNVQGSDTLILAPA